MLEVEANDVAASLKFARAKVTRNARSRPAETGASATGSGPWASGSPGGYSDEPPFL